MENLSRRSCIPIENNTPSMTDGEIEEVKIEVPNWGIENVKGSPHLNRTFLFNNFMEALEFTNIIGKIAEEQNHHPTIELTWGRVTVEWWTHSIKGLHINDFIMAAKTNKIYED